MPPFEEKRSTASDAAQKQPWENLGDLRDECEAFLIDFTKDVSEICKSLLFEVPLRYCTRHLKDVSDMHPSRLEKKANQTYFKC